CTGSMLQDVGQGLLQDPVAGQVDPSRKLLQIAAHAEPYAKPGVLHLLDELLDAAQGGSWLPDSIVSWSQQTNQAAHLADGLPPRPLDSEQGIALAPLILTQHAAHGPSLDAHHADAVADHVMQLTRDPSALLRYGRPCM